MHVRMYVGPRVHVYVGVRMCLGDFAPVRAYVCVRTCIQGCECVCMCMCISLHVRLSTLVERVTRVRVCAWARAHIHAYVWVRACICARMYAYMCAYMRR